MPWGVNIISVAPLLPSVNDCPSAKMEPIVIEPLVESIEIVFTESISIPPEPASIFNLVVPEELPIFIFLELLFVPILTVEIS